MISGHVHPSESIVDSLSLLRDAFASVALFLLQLVDLDLLALFQAFDVYWSDWWLSGCEGALAAFSARCQGDNSKALDFRDGYDVIVSRLCADVDCGSC